MLDGGDGMVEHHSRTGPTHHRPYTLFHRRAIAMDGALLARGLAFAETARRKSAVSID